MLNKLLNSEAAQAAYGVESALYGVSNPSNEILISILKFFVLPIIVPFVLTVGVLVFMTKKGYSKAKKVWAIVIMSVIYFAIFLGLAFGFKWF